MAHPPEPTSEPAEVPAWRRGGPRRCAALGLAVLLLGLGGCGTTAAPPAARVDAAGIALVRIPAGEFLMGSDERPAALAAAFPQLDPGRFEKLGDEAPVHRVRITKAFWLGRHEVTVAQFRRFVEASGYVSEAEADGTGGYGYDPAHDPASAANGDAFAGRDRRYSWRDPGFPQGDDHPVVNVTYADALAMARWLGRVEGAIYRLPTEAEWEYAARAGTRTRFHVGDDPAGLPAVANLFDQDAAVNWPIWRGNALAGHDGFAFTAPVGSFAPNAFGLHDMHGNVWEWCADWHADDYYARSPTDDPPGPATGTVRVRRGGSWHTWPFYARSAFRNWNTPQTRYTLLGFRLLREASESDPPAPAR
ncbi:MAG: formylglycine-generating enzyme family protein [Comamonadaceae bacterium]|nr:MAG: formylglycine-generating enzyme family protein [Comamonadaceae bacterium]